jgi:transcriptional regulator with XRE-family HTH domain
MAENSKIDMVGLGSRIRKARADCHMSQTELADACGLSVPYVSNIERGKKCFSVDILLRLAQALQVSTDKLLQLDVPQSDYAYNAEAADILADCTQEESVMLLEFMQSLKMSIRRVKVVNKGGEG